MIDGGDDGGEEIQHTSTVLVLVGVSFASSASEKPKPETKNVVV